MYRAGMGEIFPVEPDLQFFISFTVEPKPPTLYEVTEQLRAHAFWIAMAQGKSPAAVLAEQQAA